MRVFLAVAAALCALAASACTIPTDSPPPPAEPSPAAEAPDEPAAPAEPTPTPEQPLTGKTVYIDAGHGGPQGAERARQVPDGAGGTTACQTDGAVSASGYAEHTFAFQTAQLLRARLRDLGAVVLTSRTDDADSGACVDRRAEDANRAGADAAVSIHTDGGGPDEYGFHVDYADAPRDPASAELAGALRDALAAGGLGASATTGTDGVAPRSDTAGLNLAEGPSVQVVCGNLGNPIEGALAADPAVRRGYANGIADGVVAFLTTGAI